MLTAELEEFVGRATRHIVRIVRRPLAKKYPNLPITPIVADAVRDLIERGVSQLFGTVIHPFRSRLFSGAPGGPMGSSQRESLDATRCFELLHPPTKRGRLVAALEGGSEIRQIAYYGMHLLRKPIGVFGWAWRIDIENEGRYPVLPARRSAPTVAIPPAILAGAYCFANYKFQLAGPDRPAGAAGTMAWIAHNMDRRDGADPWAFVAAAFEDDPYLLNHDSRIREEPAAIMADWLEEHGQEGWARELRKYGQERSAS